MPDDNYRFSKWTGDVSNSDEYKEDISIMMDKDKSVSAFFCAKCGDANGDLNITPADARAAFDIYLCRISEPTECEKENADVNCDRSKESPNITPADAQAIFNKYLGRNELPCDCSCGSREASALTKMKLASDVNLIIDDVKVYPGEEVYVPIIIDNPFNLKAYGFDLLFHSELLEFIGIDEASSYVEFEQIDANLIAFGVLRVGGYRKTSVEDHSPRVLISLIFKV